MVTSAESSLQASDSSPIPRALLAQHKMQTQLSQALGHSTRSPLSCLSSPFAARLLELDPLPSSRGWSKIHGAETLLCTALLLLHRTSTSI